MADAAPEMDMDKQEKTYTETEVRNLIGKSEIELQLRNSAVSAAKGLASATNADDLLAEADKIFAYLKSGLPQV